MNQGSLHSGTKIREFFASIANRYDLANHLLSFWCDVWWRQWVAREVRRLEPRRVLDLATGSGDLAVALRQACPKALVVGADFCAPMLAVAQRKSVPHLVVADGMQLPFASGSFDVVSIAFGLRNMEDWTKALKECARVLQRGGHLVVLDFSLPQGAWGAVYRWYLHGILPRLAGWVTGQKQAYQYLAESIEKFPSGKAMQALMAGAGLEVTRQVVIQGGVVTAHWARR